MKLLLVCLCTFFALAFGNVVDLEFKKSGETGNINHFETSDFTNNDDETEEKRFYIPPFGQQDTCQSGYSGSKYCRIPAYKCFGNGQTVYIRFNPAFQKPPKVMIGLTMVDTHKDQNVRIRTSVTSVTKHGFFLKFHPWDKSITYQIGVNWMACP